jgi:hypothetical protein
VIDKEPAYRSSCGTGGRRGNPKAKENAMARRNARTSPPSIESYLFEVSIGEPNYGLSIADPKREPGLYSEHWHLELKGRCIAPEALAGPIPPT